MSMAPDGPSGAKDTGPARTPVNNGRQVPRQHPHSVTLQGGLHQGRRVGILVWEQSGSGLSERDLRAQAGERLREFATDTSAAHHGEALW